MRFSSIQELDKKIARSIGVDSEFPILAAPDLGLVEPFQTAVSIRTEISDYADISTPEERHLKYGNECGISGKMLKGDINDSSVPRVWREMPNGPFHMQISMKSEISPLVLQMLDKDGNIFEEVDLISLGKEVDKYVTSMREVFSASTSNLGIKYIQLKDEERRNSHEGLSQAIYEVAYKHTDLIMRELPTDYLARVIGLLMPQGFAKGIRGIRSGDKNTQHTYGKLNR